MLTTITLSGLWLLAGHVLAFLIGIFTSQYIKDTLKGMPGPLRAALKAHEKTSLASLKDAETKAINDTMTKLGIALPAAKPVAAKPVAPAVGADVLAALKGAATAIEGAAAKLARSRPRPRRRFRRFWCLRCLRTAFHSHKLTHGFPAPAGRHPLGGGGPMFNPAYLVEHFFAGLWGLIWSFGVGIGLLILLGVGDLLCPHDQAQGRLHRVCGRCGRLRGRRGGRREDGESPQSGADRHDEQVCGQDRQGDDH